MRAVLGSIFFAGQQWLWPTVIAGMCAFALVAWAYARTPASRKVRTACAAFKLAGLAALLVCLLEPMWTGQRAKPGANLLAIVADNSASMSLHSSSGKETRGAELREKLSGERGKWRADLAANFDVREYLADSRLRATEDFRELNFEGRSSALGDSLTQLRERHHGQPLAGIILLTDGVASDLEDRELAGLPPVYPVVFGSDSPPRDISIASTSVTQTAFEDAPVTMQVDLAATGRAGEEIVAKLLALDPATGAESGIAEQRVSAPRDGEKAVVRFQVRPEKTGVLFYRLRATPTKWPEDEATLANNNAIVTVDRGGGPHRVLYVSGRPNWEYKFLQRAIAGDDQTQLVALIRIARREAKFEFRGRDGESSNPLFRGFGNQSAEEIERHDQPVLVRLNTQDEFELRDGFPKTAEELFKYRAVIVDDLEAEFFTADQMSLLQRFVSERGGGFLMLGGAESFAGGKYERTPIGEMLPVYLREPAPTTTDGAVARLALTREGLLEHWARLRATEADERKRLGELPDFDVLNRVQAAKPAATVVALAVAGAENAPALVTQRFGRGRTAAMLIGDMWHAGLGDEERQRDLGKMWRQTVRWLVADVPHLIEMRAEPQGGGEKVRLEVRARDASFQPLDDATVTLQVQPIGAPAITLRADASPREPGLYEAMFIPRESSAYRVDATVTDENGLSRGVAQAGWSSELARSEFRSLTPNRALMAQLAQKTGGEVLTPDRLAAFARELPARRAPINESWTRPLWHTPIAFLFALTCFVAEWGIRRGRGLA